MGSLIHLHTRRRSRGASRPPSNGGATIVSCSQCGEPHPIVRMVGGEQRCVTAFFDGTYWFCRNRGCRRAWVENVERG